MIIMTTTINKHNSILPIIVGIIMIIIVTASIAANAAATTTNTTTITITKPFPCLSGDINDYCLGYHHGASAADKDRSNDNSTVSFNQYRCNDGNSQYCAGFARGYVDETAELQ
jgi:hypothetical protein